MKFLDLCKVYIRSGAGGGPRGHSLVGGGKKKERKSWLGWLHPPPKKSLLPFPPHPPHPSFFTNLAEDSGGRRGQGVCPLGRARAGHEQEAEQGRRLGLPGRPRGGPLVPDTSICSRGGGEVGRGGQNGIDSSSACMKNAGPSFF